MKTIIKDIPKVELHLHLDGSVRVETVAQLLHMDIDTAYKQMVCDETVTSLTDYLTKFELPLKVMQTEENLKRITHELLENLKKEHVIYAEIRFAPLLHTNLGLTQEKIVKAVLEGAKQVGGIKVNFILCCMRQDIENQNKHNLETIFLAHTFQNQGVVAIDLAGDESKYPTEQFKELFQKAKELQIPYTIHVGEASDYHSIESALLFKPKRIGHGIAAIQNEETIKKLNQQNILLEICPESNCNTKVVSEKKNHPLKQLYRKTAISINTDNRTVSNITLTKEYEDAMKLFQFTLEDLKKCNLNAIDHAFMKEEEKEELKKQIEEEFYDTTYRS